VTIKMIAVTEWKDGEKEYDQGNDLARKILKGIAKFESFLFKEHFHVKKDDIIDFLIKGDLIQSIDSYNQTYNVGEYLMDVIIDFSSYPEIKSIANCAKFGVWRLNTKSYNEMPLGFW